MEKQEIETILKDAILEVSPFAAELMVDESRTKNKGAFLVDLGINSIDYALIAHIVMSKLNIEFSLDILTRTNRIDDVVDIFYDLSTVEA